MRSLAAAAACLALAALAGCGGDSSKATISGKVAYNNAPVTGGTLTLYPASGAPYPINIKADGTFNVSDVPVGEMEVGIDTGAVPVAPPAGSAAGQGLPPHVDIPKKYKDPKTSGLTWDVKGGEEYQGVRPDRLKGSPRQDAGFPDPRSPTSPL